MRRNFPFLRTAGIATGALALAACGGEMTDDEVPYNEGNTAGSELEELEGTENAIPAPEETEGEIEDVPSEDIPGVTPNTVEGVGSGDAQEERPSY